MCVRLLLPFLVMAFTASANGQVTGGISSVGSDTLGEVMRRWGEAFQTEHPGVAFSLQSLGSATAPAALTIEESNVAPMSRLMTPEEVSDFERWHGHEPTAVRVALDALAVYVHRDNPIKGLSMDQVDAIFSSTRSCRRGLFSDNGNITDWGDISFSGLGSIRLFGRDDQSGTHDFFAEHAMCGGEFKDGIVEYASSADVVAAVASDPAAIGYAGIGYRTDGVKAVALSSQGMLFESAYYSYYVEQYQDDPDLERRYGWVVRGRYPLTRYLYIYVDSDPELGLEPLLGSFIAFALSERGQGIAHEVGYIPLPADVLRSERDRLGIE